MKYFISILLMITIFENSFANSLNNLRRNQSVSILNKTQVGQELLNMFSNREDLMSKYIIETTDENNLFEFNWNKSEITLKAEILASSSTYYSWMLVQALLEFKVKQVERKHGLKKSFGYFIEKSQWAFILAHRHWSQIGSPNNHDPIHSDIEDLRDKINFLDASVSKFDKLWKKKNLNLFLNAVEKRHINLGYGDTSIDDIIENAKSRNEKAAARELKEMFNALVKNECSQLNRTCSLYY